MRIKLIILPFVLLILAFSVSALKVEDAQCYDDGSFIITLKANNEKWVKTREIIMSADDKRLIGVWDNDQIKLGSSAEYKRATFTGRENQLVESRTYKIDIFFKEGDYYSVEDSELSLELECPGLLFSCQKLGVKVKDCMTSKSGKFVANVDIYGLEQSEEATMDPLEVVDFVFATQLLYKDIDGRTSKAGSIPEGGTFEKVGDNQYRIEASFQEYTTNHVKSLRATFNDELKRPCSLLEYPDNVFSHYALCEYVQTEEDTQSKIQQMKEEQEKEEEKPVERTKEEIEMEIQELENKKTQIESKLKELYEETGYVNDVKEELNEMNEINEEPKTGFSIKTSSSNKEGRLNIMLLFLLGVAIAGGVLLAFLYQQGYFY